MADYLEFVVLGPPISNQQTTAAGKANLRAWRATVAGEAQSRWASPLLMGHVKVTIINFFGGTKPSVDVDNMSRPILDVLQNIVYNCDRQVRQAHITHVEIGAAFPIVGVSRIIVDALHAGNQFVYVRIEDPVAAYPLPR